jgi:predicted dehydrogenase
MTIRVAIIGCGSIAEFRHAPEYAENPETEIVALYDPQKHRAEKLAKLFGGVAVDDFNAILDDKTIDAISDCSPNDRHDVFTTQALEGGKHVLCEKPIALSLPSTSPRSI